jgi:hypothetical protein
MDHATDQDHSRVAFARPHGRRDDGSGVPDLGDRLQAQLHPVEGCRSGGPGGTAAALVAVLASLAVPVAGSSVRRLSGARSPSPSGCSTSHIGDVDAKRRHVRVTLLVEADDDLQQEHQLAVEVAVQGVPVARA